MKQLYDQNRRISIHASAREATQNIADTNADPQFQSTLPRGKRPKDGPQRRQRLSSSIHASAREATIVVMMRFAILVDFNPRFREGSDYQPLLPYQSSAYFNPRFREGSDSRAVLYGSTVLTFQSTLPRGKRLCTM